MGLWSFRFLFLLSFLTPAQLLARVVLEDILSNGVRTSEYFASESAATVQADVSDYLKRSVGSFEARRDSIKRLASLMNQHHLNLASGQFGWIQEYLSQIAEQGVHEWLLPQIRNKMTDTLALADAVTLTPLQLRLLKAPILNLVRAYAIHATYLDDWSFLSLVGKLRAIEPEFLRGLAAEVLAQAEEMPPKLDGLSPRRDGELLFLDISGLNSERAIAYASRFAERAPEGSLLWRDSRRFLYRQKVLVPTESEAVRDAGLFTIYTIDNDPSQDSGQLPFRQLSAGASSNLVIAEFTKLFTDVSESREVRPDLYALSKFSDSLTKGFLVPKVLVNDSEVLEAIFKNPVLRKECAWKLFEELDARFVGKSNGHSFQFLKGMLLGVMTSSQGSGRGEDTTYVSDTAWRRAAHSLLNKVGAPPTEVVAAMQLKWKTENLKNVRARGTVRVGDSDIPFSVVTPALVFHILSDFDALIQYSSWLEAISVEELLPAIHFVGRFQHHLNEVENLLGIVESKARRGSVAERTDLMWALMPMIVMPILSDRPAKDRALNIITDSIKPEDFPAEFLGFVRALGPRIANDRNVVSAFKVINQRVLDHMSGNGDSLTGTSAEADLVQFLSPIVMLRDASSGVGECDGRLSNSAN